jgi:ABC-type uncharacterized transport system involved in gliding motility auxiliary subunit
MALVVKVLAGLVLWGAGFSILYALHGLGCGLGWTDLAIGPLTLLQAVLVGTWLALRAMAAARVAWYLWRSRTAPAESAAHCGRSG